MNIQSLRLKGYRNYQDLHLDIPPGTVVFLGPNGQGKTNLIEALHLLLKGESFRPTSLQNFLYADDFKSSLGQARLEAIVNKNDLKHVVQMSVSQSKKSVEWNGNRVSSFQLASQFPIVLFSPESLEAIKDGPEARRRLTDEVILTHSNLNANILKEFRHALKSRNRVLKDCLRGETSRLEAEEILESLDPSFLPLATALTMARLEALAALQEDFQRAIAIILAQENVDISVDYLVSGRSVLQWSRSDLLSAMHKRAAELRPQELSAGSSLVGPQRHDIQILFTGKDSRFYCSQGQQRALILSFKIAQILYHYRSYQVYPLLLLDDVLSELDPARRTNLVSFLRDIPAQIFLTTTDLSFSMDFGARGPSVFCIEKGMVSARKSESL